MTIRVLIIEDSPIAQQWLRDALEEADDIQVVGVLETGGETETAALLAQSDVVLLDLLLPARSGLSLASELAREKPVVIVSDSAPESPMVSEAMARGAGAHLSKRALGEPAGRTHLLETVRRLGSGGSQTFGHVFALVGSTGALETHDLLLRALRPTAPPVVLLQHMPSERDATLVDWVAARGWRVRFARHGDRLVPGRVLIAPSGQGHLLFRGRQHLALRPEPPVDGHVPSASALLQSAAALGGDLTAVILSGLGCDGARGAKTVLDAGGHVLAVDPARCSAPSMPRAALAADPRVRKGSPEALAHHVAQRAREPHGR